MNHEITVDLYPENSFETKSWNLNDLKEEPERVCVRREDKEYSIVFDDEVRFEIWGVDENGELGERELVYGPGMDQFMKMFGALANRSFFVLLNGRFLPH